MDRWFSKTIYISNEGSTGSGTAGQKLRGQTTGRTTSQRAIGRTAVGLTDRETIGQSDQKGADGLSVERTERRTDRRTNGRAVKRKLSLRKNKPMKLIG